MRVVRIYHAGRDATHRERDRALVSAGAELMLVVPSAWPGPDDVGDDVYDVVELDVRRCGDVNRHTYREPQRIVDLVASVRPDVVDLQEEPFSSVVHQLLSRLDPDLPAVGYTAQNIDKRFPPPFAQRERAALRRLDGMYPCSRQAASVVVGKGFSGAVEVLPLATPSSIVRGAQQPPTDELRLLLVGRFLPEKGVLDAVRVLAAACAHGRAALDLVGAGPEEAPARALAAELGVADALTVHPWLAAPALAERYARAHVLLAPSTATRTWVEQFGRMVGEGQAAGAVIAGYASGSLPEVIGAAGLIVPEHDVAALSSAVAGLRRDPVEWTRLRDLGLAAARGRTWAEVAKAQLILYELAVARTGARLPVRPRRRSATQRYGSPASVPGSDRPFALPLLRDSDALSRVLSAAVDAVARADAGDAPERPRVVFLDHVARMSGGELALLRLIESMPEVDAHVILAEDGPLRVALESAGAIVELLELDPTTRDLHRDALGGRGTATAIGAYTVRLARRLRELDPDLVHANSLKSGFYGTAAARLARVPVLWHLRDRISADYLPAQTARGTRAVLAAMPDLVVCNSQETRRTAGDRVRAVVVHDPYAPTREPRTNHLRFETIGIVGRLAEWKGQDVFLRALAKARESYPELRGRVIGSALFGENLWASALHELAAELGLLDAVVFTGHVDDVEAELAGLDVLVHASRVPEPFGQVIIEGLAAGIPVIATDAGGPAEILTDGLDGLLVPPGDVVALAAAIDRCADAGLRAQLAAAGVTRARAFAPQAAGRRMRELYSAILLSSGRRSRR